MKKLLFFTLILLFASGCSLQTKVGAHTQYRLKTPPQQESFVATKCKDDVLVLKNIINYDPLTSRSITYQVGDLKLASYADSNWESPLFKTLDAVLLSNIRETKIFKDAIASRSSAKADFILEYSVGEFIQHFSEDMNSSYALVNFHVALLDVTSSKLLYASTIEKKIPSQTLDAQGGVTALQEALGAVMEETNIWLHTQCQKGL